MPSVLALKHLPYWNLSDTLDDGVNAVVQPTIRYAPAPVTEPAVVPEEDPYYHVYEYNYGALNEPAAKIGKFQPALFSALRISGFVTLSRTFLWRENLLRRYSSKEVERKFFFYESGKLRYLNYPK